MAETSIMRWDAYESKPVPFSNEEKLALKDIFAKDLSNTELKAFCVACLSRKLDPLARQIYAIKYGGQMVIQVGIDGFRSLAQRSGTYAGQVGPWWCGEDGVWKEMWHGKTPPVAAKVGVLAQGFQEPVYGIAHFDEYVKKTRDGRPANLWASMPANMLAKCAEALALRKAFPEDVGGIYTHEEMQQAQAEVKDVPKPGKKSFAKKAVVVETRPAKPEPEKMNMEQESFLTDLISGDGDEFTEKSLNSMAKDMFGVKSVWKLNNEQAAEVIEVVENSLDPTAVDEPPTELFN